MKNKSPQIRPLVLLMLLVALTAGLGNAQRPVIRIGVAIDGPWERNTEIRERFEAEITQLLRREYDVQFPNNKRLLADFTARGVKENLDRLLADPEVDYVLWPSASSAPATWRGGDR